MAESVHVTRLKKKLEGLVQQREQVIANGNAVEGAIQFVQQEISDHELADQQKESDHADGEQATAE